MRGNYWQINILLDSRHEGLGTSFCLGKLTVCCWRLSGNSGIRWLCACSLSYSLVKCIYHQQQLGTRTLGSGEI